MKTFIADSFFLNSHQCILDFATRIANPVHPQERFSLVCERKEDVRNIRAQLFSEIKKREGNEASQIFAGVSMYTLDNLAQNITATLSNNDKNLLGDELSEFLQNPFLDVVTQENLLNLLLLHFGYKGMDSLPLAKQLLTFIDCPWPPDTGFLDIIKESQSLGSVRTVQEITEESLRQILATFQSGTKLLQKFSRLQSVLTRYLSGDFLDALRAKVRREPNFENLFVPWRFLSSTIVWIAAPEYRIISSTPEAPLDKVNEKISFYRPGNFQASVVDLFRDTLAQAQEILTAGNGEFWHGRTVIPVNLHPEISLEKQHISYLYAQDKHKLHHDLKQKLTSAAEGNPADLMLLADFDPGSFREITADASGSYPITDKEVELFFEYLRSPESKQEVPPENSLLEPRKILFKHLQKCLEEFAELWDILATYKEELSEVAVAYGVDYIPLESGLERLFTRSCLGESFNVGDTHPISQVDRALSFLPVYNTPERIIAVGRAHAPASPSFNVKILNNCFYILKKQNVPLDILASDVTYRGFWSSLASTKIPIEFWLPHYAELEKFPQYLIPELHSKVGPLYEKSCPQLRSSLLFRVGEKHQLHIDDWTSTYGWETTGGGLPVVNVTQFDIYIKCPLQFFLKIVLGLENDETDYARGDPRTIGTRAHDVAEKFLSRLKAAFQETPLSEMEQLLLEMKTLIRQEAFFLHAGIAEWRHELQKIFSERVIDESRNLQLRAGLEEVLATIFEEEAKEDKYDSYLTREMLKRTFLRLIEVEYASISKLDARKNIAFLEFPLQFPLGGLHFKGRIDRVDVGFDGFHIIDYKTSRIPKKEKKLVVFPHEYKPQSTEYSVQGALYTYGWSLRQKDAGEERPLGIKSFSLYRLKNLDEGSDSFLVHNYDEPVLFGEETFELIKTSYEKYAVRLASGDFSPLPMHEDTCVICHFRELCPLLSKTEEDIA